jgi:hypothetical protein
LRARRSKPQRLKDLEFKCRLPARSREGGLTAISLWRDGRVTVATVLQADGLFVPC